MFGCFGFGLGEDALTACIAIAKQLCDKCSRSLGTTFFFFCHVLSQWTDNYSNFQGDPVFNFVLTVSK